MDPDLTRTLELLRRAQGGSNVALNVVFERYYERVRRIVRVRLGQGLRARMDSGDILQETFLSALKSFDRFEVHDEAEFIHWLSSIAENQIRHASDYHRAKKRTPLREVSLDAGADSRRIGLDPAASGTLPPDASARSEQTDLVEQCLGELPEEYRELIILRDYMGATWETIAQQTNRPSADAARMKHATALVELARSVRKARTP